MVNLENIGEKFFHDEIASSESGSRTSLYLIEPGIKPVEMSEIPDSFGAYFENVRHSDIWYE